MKKKFFMIILILLFFNNLKLSANKLSTLELAGEYISGDSNFNEIYGNFNLLMGTKLTLGIFKPVYIWGEYEFLNKSSVTSTLKKEVKSKKSFINFGMGFRFDLSRKTKFFLEGGGSIQNFNEESFGSVKKGSHFGLKADTGIYFFLSKSFFFRMSVGYIEGKTKFLKKDIQLGGVSVGFGLGITL